MWGTVVLVKCAESVFACAKVAMTERNVLPTRMSHGT